jgi:hypothetical protein
LARNARFEVAQFPPVIGDGRLGGAQERSKLALRHQITLELQHQPSARGAVRHCYER